PGSAAARPLFDLQQQLTNRTGPWGYGCINGRTVPDEYIEVVPIGPEVKEVVLTTASDRARARAPQRTRAPLDELHATDPAAIDTLWTAT
ncbi:MAG: hypothetical protein GY929_26525, partial [Actinomycetia bacterium]|nr:hypothetical protein [Actinomycetes bacterium]